MEPTTETRILGAALAEPALWLSQADKIHPGIFASHRALATCLCEMRDTGQATDPQTVAAWLRERGKPVSVAELLEISEHAPLSPESMAAAVNALHQEAKRAALVRLGRTMAEAAESKRHHADDILQQSLLKLTEIGARSAQALEPIGQALQRVVNGLGKPVEKTVKTGIADVDNVTSGFRPGQLVVLGARPSMGKTSLAVGIARQAALAGRTVAFFTLEMSADEVVQRLLADLGDVELARIATHNLREQDLSAVLAAANRLHKTRVFIGENCDHIDSVCTQLRHQHGGVDLIVVDYLQLMSVRAESREQQIATLSRGLKRLAQRVKAPVLVLSQLNRQIEQRANKRPQLSDLRESGAIEQDADIVLLLWREGYYSPDADQTKAELVVAKHRNGPTGLVSLQWDQTRARFSQAKSP